MGIEDIYMMLINGLDLTDITLEQYGFTKDDINNLIINKQLRIVDNTYSLVSVKKFFSYGVSLLRAKNLSSANACFYRCYELNSHIKEVCLQVLTIELKRQRGRIIKDFKLAFDIFTNLETITPKRYENNNDLYLYLFGFIFEDMPSNYKERISNMKISNLMLDNKLNNKDENEVRKAILRRKFKYAIKLLDDLIRKQNNYPVRYELLRTLLNEVIDADINFNNKLLYLIKNNKYEDVINILEKRKELINLSINEENTLLIVSNILKIINTNDIPLVKESNTNNLKEAIINNDFKLALDLVNNYIEKYNLNKEDNIVYLLLIKINNLIESKVNDKDKEILEIEELAYYISSINMSIDEAKKRLGLTTKVYLLIKLIYVRDYYIEGRYIEGDNLLKNIESYKGNYIEVDKLLEEIKINRNEYIKELDVYIRKRSK